MTPFLQRATLPTLNPRWILIVTTLVFVLGSWLSATTAQTSLFAPANQAQDDKPLAKKTGKGLEISLLKVELVRERDDLNNVPIYRIGSCPPGAAANGIKMFADSGTQVYVVRLGIKVLSDYKDGGVTVPTISDSEDKKYSSKNTMLPASLANDLSKLKATGQQLECEFPFEVRDGRQLKELQYDSITFEIHVRQ